MNLTVCVCVCVYGCEMQQIPNILYIHMFNHLLSIFQLIQTTRGKGKIVCFMAFFSKFQL